MLIFLSPFLFYFFFFVLVYEAIFTSATRPKNIKLFKRSPTLSKHVLGQYGEMEEVMLCN